MMGEVVGPSCQIRPVVSSAALEPLLSVLANNEPVARRREFPCGTLLPDGRLDLCKQVIGAQGARDVAHALRTNEHVAHLLMGADRIGPQGAEAVAELVAASNKLQTVYLGCNGLGEAGAAHLATAMRGNTSIRGLWLKRNAIGTPGALALADMLQHNQTLRTLDVVDNEIGPDGLRAIVDAVIRGGQVRHLFLCANDIGAEGCPSLTQLLHADTLHALYVSTNHIGCDGAEAIADGLAGNRNLRVLGLASNAIGPRGVCRLAAAVARHPALEVLDLGHAPATDVLGEQPNSIGDEGAHALANMLQVHQSLRELKLNGGELTEAGALVLVEALRNPTPLVKLSLGRRLPQPFAGQLVTRMCRNTGLFPRAGRTELDRDLAAIRSVYRTKTGADVRAVETPVRPPENTSKKPVYPDRTNKPGQPKQAVLGCSEAELETCLEVLRGLQTRRDLLASHTPQLAELRSLMAKLLRIERRGRPRVDGRKQRRARDRRRIENTGIRQLRREMRDQELPDYDALVHQLEASPTSDHRLEHPRHCYICKRSYLQLHHFYDSLCPRCAAENYARRFASADLRGRVVLITGARIKIGYQVTLKLLRAGAEVHATTRFAHDAARRYAREPDFSQFADRLHIHRIDLRDIPFVEAFANHLADTLPRLDILINNAAQTVLKPRAFYEHLTAFEAQPVEALPAAVRPLVADTPHFPARFADGFSRIELGMGGVYGRPMMGGTGAKDQVLSRIDPGQGELFPPGSNDGHGQPLDLRTRNSWRLRADEVTTPELLEVHLINGIAPYLLVARLRRLLASKDVDTFVVNVSAVEGQFERGFKSVYHPHTNMAKAGLNMLTRTSASDYARDRIFMNSVDTGWITNENPYPIIEKMAASGFDTPIDEIDAAARICDPIFSGIRTGEPTYGHFLKDYRPVPW